MVIVMVRVEMVESKEAEEAEESKEVGEQKVDERCKNEVGEDEV